MKENYGNLDAFKKLGEGKKLSFTKEQLIDKDLKNIDGESNKEVEKRMNEFFDELIKTIDDSRNIAVVSHGASIKFFLSKYCTLNDDVELVYKNNVLKITSPCVLKLEIVNKKIDNIKQIY